MARYVFSLPTLSVQGRPGRVTFFDREVGGLRLTDLWLFDDDENPTEPLPNGLLVTTSAGASDDFLGPDGVDNLWYSVNGGSRAEATGSLAQGSPGAADIPNGSITFAKLAPSAIGTTSTSVAAGNDSRILGAAQKSANLSDIANAGTARTNLGLAATATMTPSALAADAALTAAFEARVTLVADSFTRADSASSLGTADVGGAWTSLAGTWGISGNKAYLPSAGAEAWAVHDTGRADIDMQVTVAAPTVSNQGLCWRMASAGNGYRLAFSSGGTLKLFRVTGGTSTEIAAATGVRVPTTGDVVRVTAYGSTHRVYRNADKVLEVSDSTYLTETRHGLWGYLGATASARAWDDYILSTAEHPSPTYGDGRTRAALVPRPGNTIDVRDRGGVADAATNNGPALLSALTTAKTAKSTMPGSLSTDQVGNTVIYLPAGDYVVTDLAGLLGQEAMTSKIKGLRIVGDGAGLTRVIFSPASAGALCTNNYWLNLQFEGIGFYTTVADCTFMHSNTTQNAQRYQFINCHFARFKYAFYLEGSNNNSEFAFINCHSEALQDDGAFLRIPTTGSDQFLNYWFFGCTHWSTDAPFIDADKGGHFKIYGLDVSDWGGSLAATGHLFKLKGASHSQGVCTFIADGVRVEAKNALAALLYSEWPQGNVDFRAVDWSSQVGTYTYGDIISINYTNVAGPRYTFKDSNLAGGVLVAFASNDWQHYHHILFADCEWHQKSRPSDVVTYSAGVNPTATPPVEFRRCRSRTAATGDVTSTDGAYTWDATVGYRGQLIQTLSERTLSIRALTGIVSGASTLKFRLPVGAIITEFRVLAPAGGTAEADGGTWTLATTEGTPTTVATVTAAGALSAGFNEVASLSPPFLCSTADKSNLAITATNVSAGNNSGLMLVKGYW